MAEFDFDVCVIGGGPSGIITAIQIGQAGYSCVILDKKPREEIGHKNCGDALDAKHVTIIKNHMGIADPSLEKGEARTLVNKITIAANGLENKISALNLGYVVDRLKYGQRLLEIAVENNVEIKDKSIMRGLIIEDNQIMGVNYQNSDNEKKQIRAKVTVDASGIIGSVRKEIPDGLKNGIDYQLDKKYTIKSYREIIELKGMEHDFVEEIVLIYDKRIPPPGYIWIFSEGPSKLNIGITWVKTDPFPNGKTLKTLYHELLDPYFDPSTYEVLYAGGGTIPMRPNFDSLVFNGAVLVGDAAAVVDPTTFEGHGPALESGRLAAKAIILALEINSFKTKDLWSYNKNFMNYPGGMHGQSFVAANFLRSFGVKNIEFLLKRQIINEHELRDLFLNPDPEIGILWIIKKILKLFPRWDLLFKLKPFVNQIEAVGKIYSKYPSTPDKLQEWIVNRDKILKI